MNINALQSAVAGTTPSAARTGARIDIVSNETAAPAPAKPSSEPLGTIRGVLSDAENRALAAAFGRPSGYSPVGRSTGAPPVLGSQLDLSA